LQYKKDVTHGKAVGQGKSGYPICISRFLDKAKIRQYIKNQQDQDSIGIDMIRIW